MISVDKIYCVFGDSVTQAGYVKTGWVEQLRHYLEEKYPDDNISVFNLGINGNTTDDIIKRFEAEATPRFPTNIVFAIGINDTKFNDEKLFAQNIQKLISLAKIFTPKITFVGLTLGNWTGEDPFSEERTTKYNEIIREPAESNGCQFISLDDKLSPEDFMDGLHPNDSGHQKMFEEIKKFF